MINTENIASGIYILSIIPENGTKISQKFIIQH